MSEIDIPESHGMPYVMGERDGRRFMVVDQYFPSAMARTFARLEWLIDDKDSLTAEQVQMPGDSPDKWAWLIWEPEVDA